MKKNSLITLVIFSLLVGILISINVISLDSKSTLTCIRDNNKKIVYKLNKDGIKSVLENDKKVSNKKLAEYKLIFASDFAWNNVSDDSYIKMVKKHMSDIVSYEENVYDSECDFVDDKDY